MRNLADSLMTDTCKIEVRGTAKGESGEVLQNVYTVVATGVSCRLIMQSTMTDRADRTAERETITEQYRLVCPVGTALAVDQRVTITSDGLVYQVVDLIRSRTSETDEQAVLVRISG